jgi:hypothetical protein
VGRSDSGGGTHFLEKIRISRDGGIINKKIT